MSDLIERISFIVPVISFLFILIITSINLYIKIRQKFPIRVNCWFCNVNSNVPYNDFNSWTCGSCEQYNGFDEDGDYNCDIPAQRSLQLNKRWKTRVNDEHHFYAATTPPRNGLCATCNRNQEIKMQQLASFEPNVKENFDMEIEHFREKLEKSYELCYSCQRIVKKTLSRVMNNVLGLKLAQIGAKGLQILDGHAKVVDSKKRIIFKRICLTALMVLSVWNLYNTTTSVNLSKKHLDAYFPPLVTHTALLAISYISAVKLLVSECSATIPYFTIDFAWLRMASNDVTDNINDFLTSTTANEFFNGTDFVINSAAVLLSLTLVLENGLKRLGSILVMLLWNVNMLWPKIAEGMVNDLPGDLLKISVAVLLFVVTILNSISIEEPTPEGKTKNSSFHRIYSNCDEDLSENSDGEVTLHSDSYSSTPRTRKFDSCSVLNNSFASAKSLGPTLLQSSPWMTSSTNNLNHSIRSEFQHTPCYRQSHQDVFSQHNAASDRLYFFPKKTMSERCSSMTGLNTSFRIPDDCQNKLTDLNISGTSRRTNVITCSSPTPSLISQSRHRSQLLTPARLDFHGNSQLAAPVTQTSWVAGGFFVKNNMSPQKRQQPQTVLLHPILSRTSSQSSGFESQASSAHNANANGSRESSIAGDAVSWCSEPTLIADSASQMGINYDPNSMSTTALPRPKPSFPLLSKDQSPFIDSTSRKPEPFTNYSSFPWTNHTGNNKFTSLPPSSRPIYHQFGTHRHSGGSMFNQFTHHSPSIRKGNLLKPINDSYLFDDK